MEAVIACTDGTARTLKRVLKTDYSKKQDCETILQIDDETATEDDLAGLGIILSQPPLRAPVLAQHTLGYMFSARPQDRATYFKALLEVTDLEEFRNKVAALGAEFSASTGPLVAKLELASEITGGGKHLKPLLAKVRSAAEIDAAFAACGKELIEAQGGTAAADQMERFAQLKSVLNEKQSKTFALTVC